MIAASSLEATALLAVFMVLKPQNRAANGTVATRRDPS
jgi:hypothetical protein